MSIRLPGIAGSVGRSAKTARMPWFASGATLVDIGYNGYAGVTSPATAHTKSAWVQLFASTAADAGAMWMVLPGMQATGDNGALMDIGVGASGAESVIASNLAFGGTAYSNSMGPLIPVFIPSGSRVAYRVQCASASRVCSPSVALFAAPDLHLTPRSVDVIGTSTATSRGTALSSTSGAWQEIVSATTQPYQAFVLLPSAGSESGINGTMRMTLGHGAAGSESDLLTVDISQDSAGVISSPSQNVPFYWCGKGLPAGSRLAVKHNVASNGNRVECCVVGVPYR